jgi:hypothetical protein
MSRRIILSTACLFLAGLCPVWAQLPNPEPIWGQEVDGLSVGIVFTGWTKPGQPAFEITFRNVGAKSYVLDLGIMLGNGVTMWPTNLSPILTLPTGTSENLLYFDSVNPQVGGRVDPFLVAMDQGASYSLRVDLIDFIFRDSSSRPTPLPRGRYRIAFDFRGEKARRFNTGTTGIATFNFWLGRATSGTLDFEVDLREEE